LSIRKALDKQNGRKDIYWGGPDVYTEDKRQRGESPDLTKGGEGDSPALAFRLERGKFVIFLKGKKL